MEKSMASMRKHLLLLVIGLMVVVTPFIVEEIIEEKYCYNLAFTELNKKGVQLGEVSADFKRLGYSPLQVVSTPGQKEWMSFYLSCKYNFNLINMDIFELGKSYPYHDH